MGKVTVDAPSLGKTWVFVCNEWIGKKNGDGALSKTLYPTVAETTEYERKQPFEIVFKTSDVKYAGTDATVFLEVYGTKADGTNKSDRIDFKHAPKGSFERAKEDRFNVELAKVGEVYKIRVGHDGKKSGSSWHLDSVTLINQATQELFLFECRRWFCKDREDKLISRELLVASQKVLKDGTTVVETQPLVAHSLGKYRLRVFTSDIKHAGTDSKCYVTMVGTTGDTGEIQLQSSLTNRDKFERGREDVFEHECVDLGELRKLVVRSDGAKLGAAWHLDRIVVENASKPDMPPWVFPCNAWFEKGSGDDKKLVRELEVKLDATRAIQQAESLKDEAASLQRRASIASSEHSSTDVEQLQRKANLARAQAEEAAALAESVSSKEALVEYTLEILTGANTDAGTTANIFLEILGEKEQQTTPSTPTRDRRLLGGLLRRASGSHSMTSQGSIVTLSTSTGRLPLRNDAAACQPGSKNVFKVAGLHVGTITGLKLGHDGSSKKDSWFVDKITLRASRGAGRREQALEFSVGQWLKHGTDTAMLALQPSETYSGGVRQKTYNVKIFTSELDGSTCTATKPTLTIFGDDGSSGELPLPHGQEPTAGSVVQAHFPLKDLGALLKLRLSIEKGSSWRPMRVEVEDSGTPVVFNFDTWLKDDKLSVDAAAGQQKSGSASKAVPLTYKLSVSTADERGVGTDANVFCTLFGALGDSGVLALSASETHTDPFERGNTDVFTVQSLDLGEIQRARVWHDSKGMFSSWKLDSLVVVEEQSQSRYELPCGHWLSKSKGDKQVTRDLIVSKKSVRALTASYKFEVGADSRPNNDLLGYISASVQDAQGESIHVKLEAAGGCFAAGTLAHIVVENQLALGDIKTLKLRLHRADEKQKQHSPTETNWFADRLAIKHLQSGVVTVFEVPDEGIGKRVTVQATAEAAAIDAGVRADGGLVEYKVPSMYALAGWRSQAWIRYTSRPETSVELALTVEYTLP